MSGKTRFCQFEQLRARIGRTEVEVVPRRERRGGGWPADNSGEAKLRWWVVGQEREDSVEMAPRRGRCANSSTRMLEFAEPRWVGGRPRTGRLGFANLSTQVLEFAESRRGVVGQE